jgi:hypothetical protein
MEGEMAYEREELVSIGERFVTRYLTAWAVEIMETAREDFDVLKRRGISDALLKDVKNWADKVNALETAQESEKRDLKPYVVRRRELLKTGSDWRREVCESTTAVFDSDPETLACFRTARPYQSCMRNCRCSSPRCAPTSRN